MTRRAGDIDGEIPDINAVRLTGTGTLDRGLMLGERVTVTAVGEVTGVSFKNVEGRLVRIHTVKVETAAEPPERILAAVTDYLAKVEDSRLGRTALPLEDE